MNRILAIEPNAERGIRLRQLLRENLNTVLVISTSAHAAITAMTETRPDLILASTLLSANDEQDLVAHLRATPALRHLPVLTIPPVVETPAAETRSTGLMSRLLRRPQPQVLFPMYDIGAVITRIEEALEQSKLATSQAEQEAAEEQAEEPIADVAAVESRVSDLAIDSPWLSNGSTKRAQRWALSDLPWLSSVKLPWGQHLRLVNISSSGLLVESSVRLAPGSDTTFRIGGPDLSLVVPARVIRCRVATVDSLGVKYETAAAFDQPVNELIAAGEEPSDATMRLAELVAAVEARAESGASAAELRGEFESGVLKMVTAREVRLRDVPVVENDGRESVYFTIPTSDATPAILQVTFNANDLPSAADFELLTAAADIAVCVLPITGTTRQTSVRPRPHPAPTLRVISDHSTPRELQIA